MFARRKQKHTYELMRILRARIPGTLKSGAEIGVFAGETSEMLLAEFHDLTLFMVDAWVAYDPRPGHVNKSGRHKWIDDTRAQRNLADCLNATAFAGDRAQIRRMPSVEAAAAVPDGSLDFVFIDADHTYEGVRADIAAWAGKVRKGGVVAGHDYASEHEGTSYGVSRAVDEWIAATGRKLNVAGATVWWAIA